MWTGTLFYYEKNKNKCWSCAVLSFFVLFCFCFCYCCCFMCFLILIPDTFSTSVFIILYYRTINNFSSFSCPTGELCTLTPSAIRLSQVINERDDEHSACFPQVLWLTLLEVLFAWGILAASTFLLVFLSCTNGEQKEDHRTITASHLLSLWTKNKHQKMRNN